MPDAYAARQGALKQRRSNRYTHEEALAILDESRARAPERSTAFFSIPGRCFLIRIVPPSRALRCGAET